MPSISPEWLTVLLTLAIACATVYYAVMSKRQWLATKEAIRQTDESLRLTNRARIVAASAIEERSAIKLRLLNCGKVPAVPVRVLVGDALGMRGAEPQFENATREFIGLIAPGEDWTIDVPVSRDYWSFHPPDKEAYPTMHEPGKPDCVHLFGTIAYGDHFDKSRTAQFCFQTQARVKVFEPGAGNDYP